MPKKKSTPSSKKGTHQKRISGHSNEAIDASLAQHIGDNLNARQTEFGRHYLVEIKRIRRFNWSNCIRSPASKDQIAGYRIGGD